MPDNHIKTLVPKKKIPCEYQSKENSGRTTENIQIKTNLEKFVFKLVLPENVPCLLQLSQC